MPSSTYILVDDSDTSRISYNASGSSNWTEVVSDDSNEYNATAHYIGSGEAGSFSFRFNGTSFALYGTALLPADIDIIVDGVLRRNYQVSSEQESVYSTGNQYPVFISCSNFSEDQEHLLVATTNNSFWLDYLVYEHPLRSALDAAPAGSPAQVFVADDSDLIQYDGPQGSWFSITPFTGIYDSSYTTTNVEGATVTFKFNGTQVQVYGAISTGYGSLSSVYQMDGGDVVTYTGASTTEDQTLVTFFQSPILDDGEHTLLITVGPQNGSYYVLDFILYTASTTSPQPLSQQTGISPGSSTQSSSSRSSDPWLAASVSMTVLSAFLTAILLALLMKWWKKRAENPRWSRCKPFKLTYTEVLHTSGQSRSNMVRSPPEPSPNSSHPQSVDGLNSLILPPTSPYSTLKVTTGALNRFNDLASVFVAEPSSSTMAPARSIFTATH